MVHTGAAACISVPGMNNASRQSRGAGVTALAWMPLLAGAINSYGPVAMNYGFALYFLDYRHGFVKRGLIGEMLSGKDGLPRGELIAVEYAFLAAAFALTYLVFRDLLFGSAAECRLAALLLSGPALLPHLGYLFAQPDVTLYILLLGALAALIWMPRMMGAAVSCVLCCIGLLVHEAFSLMFYPLIVAVLLHLCALRRLPWAVAAAHIAFVGAAFVAVMHFGTLKVSPDVILHEAQARTDVGIQRQVYDVMASNLAQQHTLLQEVYGAYVWRVVGLTILVALPYFALLARLLLGSLRTAGTLRWQRNLIGLLFLMPLALCLLGHDVSRWLSSAAIDATLFILWLCMDERRAHAIGNCAIAPSTAQYFLANWADSPGYVAWLVYLLVIGPFGATGIRSAEQIVQAWWGP